MLDSPKVRLSGLLENVLDLASFTGLNQLVEIDKLPSETKRQRLTDSRFTCSHKADERDRVHRPGSPHRMRQSDFISHLWQEQGPPKLILAFLEVDFTTEGDQLYRRCGLAHGAYEGTPAPCIDGTVLRFQGEVAIHAALIRAGEYVNRSIGRSYGFDVASVAGEVVFAITSKVAGV